LSHADLVLGVDVGTESARAAVFDLGGTEVGSASVPYATTFPHEGWAEQDPEEVRTATEVAIRSAASDCRDRIAGLSVASTAVTVVTVDRKGVVTGPAILWMDTRAAEEAADITRTGHPSLERTGGSVSSEWMLPKALWLKRHEPERYRQAALVVEMHDWLLHSLTGRWALSMPTICAEWSYVPSAGGWAPDLLAAVGMADVVEKWPTLMLRAGEVMGGLVDSAADATGLPAGVPVSQGMMDSYAAAIACDPFSPGRLTLSLGSSSSYLMLSDRPVSDPGLLGPVEGAFPGRWVVQGGQTSAASTLRWFMEELAGGLGLPALDEEASEVPPGSEGVGALETFQGSRTPYRDPARRGAFWGLGLGHRRAHLYRALLEAVAYGGRQVLELMRSVGLEVTEVVACGGGSRSPLWMQIHADVLSMPIEVVARTETAALGAAVCAAVGSGLCESLESGAKSFVRRGRIYYPDVRFTSQYDAGYRRYQEASMAIGDVRGAGLIGRSRRH